MAKTKTDKMTMDLIKEVQRRKNEIANIGRAEYCTNATFSATGQLGGVGTINLNVENNLTNLIMMAACVIEKESMYQQAASRLGIETPPPFTWLGFSTNDWLHDIKVRVDKVQVMTKRKELETLEIRLNAVVSPELRAQMELEAIKELLEGKPT